MLITHSKLISVLALSFLPIGLCFGIVLIADMNLFWIVLLADRKVRLDNNNNASDKDWFMKFIGKFIHFKHFYPVYVSF